MTLYSLVLFDMSQPCLLCLLPKLGDTLAVSLREPPPCPRFNFG